MNGGTKTAERIEGRIEKYALRERRREEGKPDSLPICRWTDDEAMPRRAAVVGLTTSAKRRKKAMTSAAKSILTGNQYFTFLGSFFTVRRARRLRL